MIIMLNGFKENIPKGMTVRSLIDHFEEGDPHLIIELNGRYIHSKDYEGCNLLENDVIEFINPCFGG